VIAAAQRGVCAKVSKACIELTAGVGSHIDFATGIHIFRLEAIWGTIYPLRGRRTNF
jgi:hypothetical protein